MANFNQAILIGNLCRDVEVKYTPQGTAVTNITLAINREYKVGEEKKKEVSFVPVVIWGKRAEVVHEYCKKGDPLMVEGRINTRSWEGADGKKQYKTEVVAENIQFLKAREAAPVSAPAPEAAASQPVNHNEDLSWLEEEDVKESA